MNFASTLKSLALIGFTLSIVASASAQGMQSPPPLVLTQSLEPTIKVHPSPELKIEKPAVTVQEQCVCTTQYDPVCARTREGTNATYSNTCRARCAGANVIAQGAC
jgi:hypothetical protein